LSRLRAAALSLAAAAALAGCGVHPAAPLVQRAGLLPAAWARGMNFTAFTAGGYGSAAGDRSLRALAATGTRAVALDPYWYMRDASSSVLAPDPRRTASDASLMHAMRRARALGLEVIVKPHVDVDSGVFRGQIAPASVPAWFRSYDRMVLHYASLAQRGGARTFVVATELTSMTGYESRWRALIAKVRTRFSGTLTFAANWDEGARAVRFWDALDVVGIDAYMPLRTGVADPTVKQLVAAWAPYVASIDAIRRVAGKPVLFTEIGYGNRTAAAADPAQPRGRRSGAAQARAYEAAFRVWSAEPWVRGILWWDWPAQPPATGDPFSPAGRPAERVLRRWNGRPPPEHIGS
jgi:hypothetical protein